MRNIFAEFFPGEPANPTEAARRAMRPQLPRRLYETVVVEAVGERFAPLLDGQQIKTPGRKLLAVPSHALAQALAAEWQRQGERLDPARMPLVRLVNSVIDGVQTAPAPVAAEIAKYLGSDLLFYRAAAPQALVARQAELWDPILDWVRETLDAKFMLSQGVTFITQSETALSRARAAIPKDPWRLGAVHSMTTLTGSALLALGVLDRRLNVEAAWTAAHVDEDWNIATWGRDQLALERRALRRTEMDAAAQLIHLVNA
jgi:chaperone required for assembly of F1-ATPase